MGRRARHTATTTTIERGTAIDSGVAQSAPAVYWHSSPTLLNETLLVAGAGLDSLTSAQLCTGPIPSCAELPLAAQLQTWSHSLKVVLPAACYASPPCQLRLLRGAASALV